MKRTLLAIAALIACGHTAFAQAVRHEDEDQDESPYRSPQSWAIEARLGPYSPDVDSEFHGSADPHRMFFGNRNRLLFQMEGDYQFFHRFGSAAVAVSAGYFRESAHAFVTDSTTMERSGDSTALTLFPLSAALVYRFDVPERRYHIPLVPYAKLGLTYTIWSVSNGNGDVATSNDPSGHGRGGTPGWLGAAGIAFLLNVLDPSAARGFDAESGVNRSYVFFEGEHWDASGLGRKDALHVGDTTWCAGLMFEF